MASCDYPVSAGCDPAPNHLNQDFAEITANQIWVSDFTNIDTAEGWLFLATVLDLFSRKVVGWAMSELMNATLIETAVRVAVQGREPEENLLHHSDQGSQYTSIAYQNSLSAANIQMSMSRLGNCYDNAVAESLFSTLKSECVTSKFATRALAHTTIFEYIEAWYNRQRLDSTPGYLSPVEFELNLGH